MHQQPDSQPADRVLTSRIAAALAHHEPGWTLPRQSVLARRYHVTTGEVATAIDDLVARHLIRLLPDGTACRIGPAEYMLELEGQRGLLATVEPLHGQLSCKSHSVAWHPVRSDVESALGMTAGDPACILQMLWTVSGEPAAATTTYLAGQTAELFLPVMQGGEPELCRAILPMPPARAAGAAGSGAPDGAPDRGDAADEAILIPRALHIQLEQPPPWAGRALRLSACDAAIGITVSYAEPAEGRVAALTVAVLRPDEFRVIVDSVVTPAPAAGHAGPVLTWQRPAG